MCASLGRVQCGRVVQSHMHLEQTGQRSGSTVRVGREDPGVSLAGTVHYAIEQTRGCIPGGAGTGTGALVGVGWRGRRPDELLDGEYRLLRVRREPKPPPRVSSPPEPR